MIIHPVTKNLTEQEIDELLVAAFMNLVVYKHKEVKTAFLDDKKFSVILEIPWLHWGFLLSWWENKHNFSVSRKSWEEYDPDSKRIFTLIRAQLQKPTM